MFSPFFLMLNSYDQKVSIRSTLQLFEGATGTYSALLTTGYFSLGLPALGEEYGL